MSPKKKVEMLVVKERTGELTLLSQLIKGFFLFTETALFISVGALAAAWEKIGKILKSGHEDQTNLPLQPSGIPDSPAPGKREVTIKVPLLPIDDYQQLTVEQIITRMKGFSPDQLKSVRDFESARKRRKSVLESIDRLLAGGES